MNHLRTLGSIALLCACATPASSPSKGAPSKASTTEDPFLWLEDIDGERALTWVRAQNERTKKRLTAHPEFENFLSHARSALDAPTRIPKVKAHGAYLYNLWRDAKNVRGLYRRATVQALKQPKPAWETVLDIDALSKAEGKPWVFKGMKCLPPKEERCVVELSPGGGDAVEIREFDAKALKFIPGGFSLPAAKQTVEWIDENTLFVATDFGAGSMTKSGYPRRVKVWKRGTPLTKAKQVFEAPESSVLVDGRRFRHEGGHIDVLTEWLSFYDHVYYHLTDKGPRKLMLPKRVALNGSFEGRLILMLRQAWKVGEKTLEPGTVILAKPQGLYQDPPQVEVLATSTADEIVTKARSSKRGVLVETLQNVVGRMYRYERKGEGWSRRPVPFPDNGAVKVETVLENTGDFFALFESFTTPPTLYHVDAASLKPTVTQQQSSTFDAAQFEVKQHWAKSKDGTKVPYFVVMKKGTPLNGKNPTHIFSYGGFYVSLKPSYSGSYEQLYGAYGKLWLERGGVFVLASIRGGGEFGPRWHSAALLEKRPRAFEDFEAVAEDLIARKITAPGHIGIEGRSNGGLLVGATMHRRPDLYGAVICGVPLSDMRRYHKLLAGASWVAEYGNPDDPKQWAYLSKYSPYHNLKADQKYPKTLFYTSTRDDRVHPGHARKMAAKMESLGHEVWYYENIEGGHGGSSTNDQLAYRLALVYSHLWSQLK